MRRMNVLNSVVRPHAILCLFITLPRCANSSSPERVVRELSEAAAAGRSEQVWQLLGPTTRKKLELEARRTSDLGDRQISPSQMLAAGWLHARFPVVHTRVVERHGDEAIVEVSGAGSREQVRCFRQPNGDWRVEIE